MKKISLILTFFFTISVLSVHAQQTDMQRKAEHDAVKNYIRMKLRNAPVNATTNSETINKSDFQKSLFQFSKPVGQEDRKYYFMNGNKISTNVYNFKLAHIIITRKI